MNRALSVVFALAGLALLGFSIHVAAFGAEPALPAPGDCVEGALEPGPTVESPVGAPFLYGELRLHDADNAEGRMGNVHYRTVAGRPRQSVRTARGVETVQLPAPGRWRIVSGTEDSREVASLNGLPLLADVTVGDRLSPPFRVSARVVRPGDHVIVPRASGARVGLYVGDRDALSAEREQRERGRFPMVGLLAIMGVVSFYAARRAHLGTMFDGVPSDDEEVTP